MYGEAFARPPYNDPDRGREVRARMREIAGKRESYRALAAVAPSGRVIGMIYGYHGERGQWWHDAVRRGVGRDLATKWLDDSYEVVEVAVAPAYQGLGIGRALIGRLLEGRSETTCVLSTRTDSRAHHLYRRLGFEEFAEMVFAPGGAPFYIMGKRLAGSSP